MKAGKLNHHILFVSYTQIADGHGSSVPQVKTEYRTQAHLKPLRQDRSVQVNQQVLQGGYEVYFRYRRDVQINKLWFIRYLNMELTINSIQQWDEDRRMWFVIAMVKS